MSHAHTHTSFDATTFFEIFTFELAVVFVVGVASGWYLRSTFGPPTDKLSGSHPAPASSSSSSSSSDTIIPATDNVNGDLKLVLVVNNDLQMGKGKAAAQCSHATLAAYKMSVRKNSKNLERWEREGQKKVALKVDTEAELLALHSAAKQAGLVAVVIQDAGRTQIASGSRTVLAIGPDTASAIDKITGKLKLY